MSDALISTPVGIAATATAAVLLTVAVHKIKRSTQTSIMPLMGVMGAFVFAAQMINFAIPGTGSSGHIVGGVMLAALLGPWAAFITICSVIIIQCLVFADGGLMALGCNILNMGAVSCLIAYPIVFKPIIHDNPSPKRIFVASLAACVISLELGALFVVGETELSGITALATDKFLMFMLPIHLLIGIGEGLATAAVLCFIRKTQPDMLHAQQSQPRRNSKKLLWILALCTIITGGLIAHFASSDPDGLEWSIDKVGVANNLENTHVTASALQRKTSAMPDYSHTLSGILGAGMVLVLVWSFTALCLKRRRLPRTISIGDHHEA